MLKAGLQEEPAAAPGFVVMEVRPAATRSALRGWRRREDGLCVAPCRSGPLAGPTRCAHRHRCHSTRAARYCHCQFTAPVFRRQPPARHRIAASVYLPHGISHMASSPQFKYRPPTVLKNFGGSAGGGEGGGCWWGGGGVGACGECRGGSPGGMKGGGGSDTSKQLGMRPRWPDSRTAPHQKASVTLRSAVPH